MDDEVLENPEEIAVFSLDSGRRLATEVCGELGVSPGDHEERQFDDGEHKIRSLEPVRGRDVYVVQSLYGDDELNVNDKLVRTLFFAGALRDAGAGRVTVVAPYLCYSRKDMRTKPRDPVSTRYVASMFESVGVDRVATVDVHNRAAFQNAFRVPTVHLTAAPLFADALSETVADDDVVVVSPDAGGVKRAEKFRQTLEGRLDREVSSAFIEKFRSEGVVRGGKMVGDVEGRTVVVLDDLISSGTTLVRAAESCRKQGARKTFAAATHGVFSADAGDVLGESELDRIFVADTIDPERVPAQLRGGRLEVLDCAPLLGDAIRRLHRGRL